MTWLKTLALSVLLVFAPIQAALITCLVLVGADLVLGIICAYKQGVPITSAGLRRTLSKLVIYELGIALAFLAETYLTGAILPLSKILCSFIGLTEIKSIMENLNIISGDNLLKTVLSKLNSENDKS